jgi:hypothetical protein
MLVTHLSEQRVLSTMARTTLELDDEVARQLRIFIAKTGRNWKKQSEAINELILRGIKAFEEDEATKKG